MFQTKVVEKIETYILYSITFFYEDRAVYDDNVEKRGTARQTTDDNKTRRTRFACWITKATDTHSEYVILIAFPRQQWLRKRASMLRYTYIVCLVLIPSCFFGSYVSFISQAFFAQSSHFHKGCPDFIADRTYQPDTTSLFGAHEPSLSHQPVGRSVTLNPVAK
jgi:hypothetical protein